MYILNTDIKIEDADTFFKKLIGLSFKKNINYGMRFKTCAIETFMMFSNIDICITDKDNNILELYSNFKKRRILIRKNAYFIYELPLGTNEKLKNKKKLELK